ncbi:MAG: hypothetical protein HDR88_15490 [Bacteroides sp.]|nr:hypothetical protein [Bacteroides sp.]
MIDITERYNRDKESTIQYDISELLQTDLSDHLKACLMNLDNPIICKFVALFPLQDKSKISTIRNSLNGMKDILPMDLFEETKDEVTEICNDYKWMNSKEGKMILQIEKWINEARHCIASDFSSEHIYIGRSLIEPVSLIVGGYVKELNTKTNIESCLNNMNPPIDIEYKIEICD